MGKNLLSLSEVITYCEELAKKNDDDTKEFYRISKLETHPERKLAEHAYVECKKRSDEQKQLAEWLKELREVYAMLEGCADTDELFVGYIRKRMKGEI